MAAPASSASCLGAAQLPHYADALTRSTALRRHFEHQFHCKQVVLSAKVCVRTLGRAQVLVRDAVGVQPVQGARHGQCNVLPGARLPLPAGVLRLAPA